MYLSTVHLENWRSYSDATFNFKPPTLRRQLVLVGAMNGHGKTSLLFALYLGLFGRHGFRYCEGFRIGNDEEFKHYREALQRLRRWHSPGDEPTTVELIFSPTMKDGDVAEIRLVRRWYFTSRGVPRLGDDFEEAQLYIDGRPVPSDAGLQGLDARLEQSLFRAESMPAFFFDGEQAQNLIRDSGDSGIQKSVEVLFGTKVVEELADQVKRYINTTSNKVGGKKRVSAQEKQFKKLNDERQELEAEVENLKARFKELEGERNALESQQSQLHDRLARMGGERRGDTEDAHAAVSDAQLEKDAVDSEMTQSVRDLGLALAVSRLSAAVENRLAAEETREKWENLREGTLDRTDEVLAVALPEPPEEDGLLGHLSLEIREKVQQRFRQAIEQIYHPPPTGCAEEYLLGHVKGEQRAKLGNLLTEVASQSAAEIRACARRLREAKDRLEEAVLHRDRIGDLPKEVEKLSQELIDVDGQIASVSQQIGSVGNQIAAKKAELHNLDVQVGNLAERLAKNEPQQKRIAVAERVRRVLNDFAAQLRPLTVKRLEDEVTKHFVQIADERFAEGRIEFPESGSPILKLPGQPDALIEVMSGFERRAFGIAFSLALAEITQRRLPLVIDTPIGNADTEYRPRLLRAVTEVDLDQVIVLTHDAEVNGPLYHAISDKVVQTFLVDYDLQRGESVVHPDTYFPGSTR